MRRRCRITRQLLGAGLNDVEMQVVFLSHQLVELLLLFGGSDYRDLLWLRSEPKRQKEPPSALLTNISINNLRGLTEQYLCNTSAKLYVAGVQSSSGEVVVRGYTVRYRARAAA